MKKTLIIFLIVFLLVGCGNKNKVTENKTFQNLVESKKDDKVTEDSKNTDVQEQNVAEDKADSNKSEKVEIEDKNNKTNTNANKSKSESKNTNTSKNETSAKTNAKKESNVEVKKEETNVKHTCTDADSEYVSWKSDYLHRHNTSRLYDSFDLAYAAGDKISYYSYGFIVDKSPSRYSDDTCTKEVYSLEIYVPSGICENNPVIYVPNNVDILGQQLKSVDYLKQIGYECAGKNL